MAFMTCVLLSMHFQKSYDVVSTPLLQLSFPLKEAPYTQPKQYISVVYFLVVYSNTDYLGFTVTVYL